MGLVEETDIVIIGGGICGLATALALHRALDVRVDKGAVRETPIRGIEARCLKRIDLVQALANELPSGTIRFGCQVLSVDLDKSTSNPIVQLQDGSLIKAKILIGCDGANSAVAKYIGLKPTKPFNRSAVRGLTVYPNGHGLSPDFMRIRKDTRLVGLIPIDENTVYWFVVLDRNQRADVEIAKGPTLIKQLSMDAVADFPKDIVKMIKKTVILARCHSQI